MKSGGPPAAGVEAERDLIAEDVAQAGVRDSGADVLLRRKERQFRIDGLAKRSRQQLVAQVRGVERTAQLDVARQRRGAPQIGGTDVGRARQKDDVELAQLVQIVEVGLAELGVVIAFAEFLQKPTHVVVLRRREGESQRLGRRFARQPRHRELQRVGNVERAEDERLFVGRAPLSGVRGRGTAAGMSAFLGFGSSALKSGIQSGGDSAFGSSAFACWPETGVVGCWFAGIVAVCCSFGVLGTS